MGRHTPEENARRRARYASDPEYAEKKRAASREYGRRNAEQNRARAAAWAKANPDRKRAQARRRQGMIDPPGAAKTGPCECCATSGPLECDHDHHTGAVRGWLCGHCNRTLGQARDSITILKALTTYLEHHGRPNSTG